MPIKALMLLILFFALNTSAISPSKRPQSALEPVTVDTIALELGHAKDGPKYSTLRKMSAAEVQKTLEIYTGTNDTWKDNRSMLSRAQKFIPFQPKKSAKQEITEASYFLAHKSSRALQNYAIALHQSKNSDLREMIVSVQGDKMQVYKTYVSMPPYDVRAIVLFFQSIAHGDTGLETKKFSEYSRAFDHLAYRIENAYDKAVEFNMPLILEFESSALMDKSPIMRIFFNTLVSHPEQIIKAEVTPDGGRILAIHPFYAKEIVRNLKLFSTQFELSVNGLKTRIFSDSDAKIRLMNLLRTGEGMGGLFYIEERMQDLAIKAKETLKKSDACSRIFGSN